MVVGPTKNDRADEGEEKRLDDVELENGTRTLPRASPRDGEKPPPYYYYYRWQKRAQVDRRGEGRRVTG